MECAKKLVLAAVLACFVDSIYAEALGRYKQECEPLTLGMINPNTQEWFPENCTTTKIPSGQYCHVRCKEGHRFEPGVLMFRQCVKVPNRDAQYITVGAIGSCIVDSFCGKIGNYTDVKVASLTDCSKDKVPVGSICLKSDVCGRVGPAQISCLANGTWSAGGSYCKDAITSLLTCDDRIKFLKTDPGKSTVDSRHALTKPTLAGLSMLQMSVTILDTNQSPVLVAANASLDKMPVGKYAIVYNASGYDGQTCSCRSGGIFVEDKEPPLVQLCDEEFEYAVYPDGEAILFNATYKFVDNVDTNLTFMYTRPPAKCPLGTYQESARASDQGKNSHTCTTSHQVKGKTCRDKYKAENILFARALGNSYFHSCINNSYLSYLALNLNYDFKNDFPLSVQLPQRSCTRDFYFNDLVPSCFPKVAYKDGTPCPEGHVADSGKSFCIPCVEGYIYKQDSRGNYGCFACPDGQTTSKRGALSCIPCPKNWYTESGSVAPKICRYKCNPGLILGASGTCEECPAGHLADQSASTCSACEANKIVPTFGSSCVCGKVLTEPKGSVTVSKAVIPDGSSICSYKLNFNASSNQRLQRLAVKFSSSHLSKVTNCSSDYVRISGYFKGDIVTELMADLCGDMLDQVQVVKFRPWRENVIHFAFSDATNVDLKFQYAIADCNVGMKLNITSMSCEKCPVGFYQDEVAQVTCKKCPDGFVASLEGSSFCIEKCPRGYSDASMTCEPCSPGTYEENSKCLPCPAGTFSVTGAIECKVQCGLGQMLSGQHCIPCIYGQYQSLDKHSYEQCLYCPAGKTTLKPGSALATDCIDKCFYEGEFYNAVSKACERCPVASYKEASAVTVSACTSCPQNTTTRGLGSIRASDCIDSSSLINLCASSNPCTVGGQCRNAPGKAACVCSKFYHGDHCETFSSVSCNSTSCLNGGTCYVISEADYVCVCAPGFSGKNCEQAYDPCKDEVNPCYGNGNCTNSGNYYTCSCLPEFTGPACDSSVVRPCDAKPSPCGAHGDCVNNVSSPVKYTCSCHSGFTGDHCDVVIEYCLRTPCSANGTEVCEEEHASLRRNCKCRPGFYGSDCGQYKMCDAGQWYQQLSKSCCKCAPGSYTAANNVATACISCPSGKTTLARGASGASQCIDAKTEARFTASMKFPQLHTSGAQACGLLEGSIEQEIAGFLRGDDKVKGVVVQGLRSGSVIADFIVYGGDPAAAQKLEAAVKASQLGSYQLDSTHPLNIVHLKAEGKDGGGGGTSGGVIAAAIILPLVFVILVIVAVLYYRSRNRNRSMNTEIPAYSGVKTNEDAL